jgi:flagellar P-ring protein precursor FlgI
MKRRLPISLLLVLSGVLAVAWPIVTPAFAVRIRDVARLKNEVPNEIVGMGLVLGLKGTGDGGDYLPAMDMLMAMMKRFDNPVTLEKELKNANNVAIVTLRVTVPPQGAHAGDRLDVKVMSAGAAKSLKGGQLFISPLIAPRTDIKIVLGSASGECTLDDEKNPTTATIHGGAVLI